MGASDRRAASASGSWWSATATSVAGPIAEALLQKALRDAKLERDWSVRSPASARSPGHRRRAAPRALPRPEISISARIGLAS
jgi:hypothetical protein